LGILFCFSFFFLFWRHSVGKAYLELIILLHLPLSPECWDYKWELPGPAVCSVSFWVKIK
jgi:hypothetical protein